MHLNRYCLRNFRRLENIEINLEEKDTIFVGANNAGKTSATAAFRLFVSRDRDFKIHDFSSSLISKIDSFGDLDIQPDEAEEDTNNKIPSIEMDLWFSVSPSVEYGRVANFLPSLSSGYSEIGVRICFSINNPFELHNIFLSLYPKIDGTNQKKLSYFLAQAENLKKYFSLKYFFLEKTTEPEDIITHYIGKQSEGQKALASLLRVDYVEAQRNIDDKDSAQSNRLSAVFSEFYKRNLKQREHDEASARVIDKSNEELTSHYESEFKPLINIIGNLGFPALNDRGLKIISSLSPEKALSGNTAITYLDNDTNHELPEAYNGLGFKNLIYMAIQVAHFQIQWINTELDRPLCQLIFIEEPEAHLHAQVQQTFIRKIRDVMKSQVTDLGLQDHIAQLAITTHSSHIIAEADFQCIRYFRRIPSKINSEKSKAIATEVINIAKFQEKTDIENITFLRKYLELTHCDLFFADAAILVEGTVERLLMPTMIRKDAPELESAYLTILELGGAYAHRFATLLDFINLPTLIITDLDSVAIDEEKQGNNKRPEKCRADKNNAVTSNASIKALLLDKTHKAEYDNRRKISSLIDLTPNEKICSNSPDRYVTFQQAIPVTGYGIDCKMIPRTFEEAFIYENIYKIRESKIDAFVSLESPPDFEKDYTAVYETVKSDQYKKSEFALNLINTNEEWKTPTYIIEGLHWLRTALKLKSVQTSNSARQL